MVVIRPWRSVVRPCSGASATRRANRTRGQLAVVVGADWPRRRLPLGGRFAARPRAGPAVSLWRVKDRLAYFADLVAAEPGQARARYGYANELHRAERWEEAAVELRAYLDLAEDEGNAWGKLADALTRLGRLDEAADAYLAGIDQAERHGHHGMADDFRQALEAL